MIDGIRVFEGKQHGEDLLFNIQVLERVKTAALIDEILYSYVSNEDSITHVPFNEHTVDGIQKKSLKRNFRSIWIWPDAVPLLHGKPFSGK